MSGTRYDVIHAPEDQALKIAYERSLDAVGGASKAERYSRPKQRRHSEYASLNTDVFPAVDAVRDIDRVTKGAAGWPINLRAVAAQLGCVVTPLPDADPDCIEFHEAMGAVAEEAGGLTRKLCEALKDRQVTDDEVRALRLEEEAYELVTAAVNLLAMIRRVPSGGRR
jgi:hypothetical protein